MDDAGRPKREREGARPFLTGEAAGDEEIIAGALVSQAATGHRTSVAASQGPESMDSNSDTDALLKVAQRHVRHAEYEKAIDVFTRALQIDERNVDAHGGIATSCFMSKDYDKAIDHFKRVSVLDPRQGKSLINLGAVYNRLGEYNKAIDTLRRGLQKERGSCEGYYNLGLAYRGLKQLSMAVSAYREAVRLNPQMAAAHQNLANVYVDMGNNQQAILHYKQALEIKPEFERAIRGLAAAEAAVKQARNAISPFGRLVDESNVSPKAARPAARELNDNERLKDRQTVHGFATDIEAASGQFLIHLREELEPKLVALDRSIMQAGDASTTLPKASDEFRDAVQVFLELRSVLKKKTSELRAHEEEMKSSDLPVPE
jgi:tetratricopeptide (TPR) repeat protein